MWRWTVLSILVGSALGAAYTWVGQRAHATTIRCPLWELELVSVEGSVVDEDETAYWPKQAWFNEHALSLEVSVQPPSFRRVTNHTGAGDRRAAEIMIKDRCVA